VRICCSWAGFCARVEAEFTESSYSLRTAPAQSLFCRTRAHSSQRRAFRGSSTWPTRARAAKTENESRVVRLRECESGLAKTDDGCDFQAEVRDLYTSLSTMKYLFNFQINQRICSLASDRRVRKQRRCLPRRPLNQRTPCHPNPGLSQDQQQGHTSRSSRRRPRFQLGELSPPVRAPWDRMWSK
jgi:hypothetical protein